MAVKDVHRAVPFNNLHFDEFIKENVPHLAREDFVGMVIKANYLLSTIITY